MFDATREKTQLWLLILVGVVATLLGQTHAREIFAPSPHESGIFATQTQASTGQNYDGIQYDALDSLLAANGGARIASEAGLSAGEIARIQNAANRIGKPINLVGSRASGTANAASDWDYVIEGMTNANKNTIKNSLPGAPIRADQVPRNIDFFTDPLRTDLPHIQFNPR